MMRVGTTLLLISTLWMGNPVSAEVTTDDRLWLSTSLRGELMKDFTAELTQQLRLPLAGEYNRQIIPSIGVSYAPISNISIGSGARYSFEKRAEDETDRCFRVHGELGLETPELGPIELGYRLRYQSESSILEDEPKNRVRNRLSLKISTETMFRPGAFYEHFLDPQGEVGEQAQKHRIGGDLSIKLDPTHRIRLKYFQDTELDGDGDKVRVYAMAYRFTL